MGDYVDELVGRHLKTIREKVTAGLRRGKSLDKLVTVGRWERAEPFRVVDVSWTPLDGRHADVRSALGHGDTLQESRLEYQSVFELSTVRDESVRDLEDEPDAAIRNLSAWAEAARDTERRVVLGLICRRASETRDFTLEDVRTATSRIRGMCRLLAPPEHDVSKQAKRAALVEEVIAPDTRLPDQIVGALIPLLGGPIIERLVDDLTLTWTRVGNNSVRFRLSERFLVTVDRARPITFRQPP